MRFLPFTHWRSNVVALTLVVVLLQIVTTKIQQEVYSLTADVNPREYGKWGNDCTKASGTPATLGAGECEANEYCASYGSGYKCRSTVPENGSCFTSADCTGAYTNGVFNPGGEVHCITGDFQQGGTCCTGSACVGDYESMRKCTALPPPTGGATGAPPPNSSAGATGTTGVTGATSSGGSSASRAGTTGQTGVTGATGVTGVAVSSSRPSSAQTSSARGDGPCTFPVRPLKDVVVGLSIVEETSQLFSHTYMIDDPDLLDGGDVDFTTGAQEEYDIYISDAGANRNPNGSYLTIKTYRNTNFTDGATGNNIDAVELYMPNGLPQFADRVTRVLLGTGLSPLYSANAGYARYALGASDGTSTKLGDQSTSLTLGFCEALKASGSSASSSGSAGDLPDLTVTDMLLTIVDASVHDIDVVGTVSNIGVETAEVSKAGVWVDVGRDGTFDLAAPKKAVRQLLRGEAVRPVDFKDVQWEDDPEGPPMYRMQTSANLAAQLLNGDYSVVMCADADEVIEESNEDNNCTELPYVYGEHYDPSCKQNATSNSFRIVCTSTGQMCTPVLGVPIQTTLETPLEFYYSVPEGHCSSVKVHIYVDNQKVATTPFMGYNEDEDVGPLEVGPIALGTVAPGNHTVTLQAEGQVGGCNEGQLNRWGGNIEIVAAVNQCPLNCGNGVLDSGEQCDDGNQVNEDACTNACKPAACGDGFKQEGEECEPAGHGACDLSCRQGPYTGPSPTTSSSSSRSSSSSSVTIVPLSSSSASGGSSNASNGSNASNSDSSSSLVVFEGSSSNSSAETFTFASDSSDSSDTSVETYEEYLASDSSDSSISSLELYVFTEDDMASSSSESFAEFTIGSCGNGLLEEGEACDDGNNVNGDGCDECRTQEMIDRASGVLGSPNYRADVIELPFPAAPADGGLDGGSTDTEGSNVIVPQITTPHAPVGDTGPAAIAVMAAGAAAGFGYMRKRR